MSPEELTKDSELAVEKVLREAKDGKKIVFVSGSFNILHPGHLRLLRFAAECGDHLVVGVFGEKLAEAAVVPEELRLEGVRSIGFVHTAFLLKDPPDQFIRRLRPAFVVKGKEFEDQYNAEQAAVDSYGGKLLFGSGEVRFSSLDLLKKEQEINLSTIAKPLDFPARHGFGFQDLAKILSKFAGLKVVVVGDLIIDDYINCDPLGMSQEDPTVVVTPVQSEKFLGGAGIVAAHAKGLGGDVKFFTVVGKDETAKFAQGKLDQYGVSAFFFEDESRPTSLKQRFRASSKTLLRVSHLRQHAISRKISDQMAASIKDAAGSADLVVFADFNYGCLPQVLVDEVVDHCGQKHVPMVADSQSSSQVGNVSRFQNQILLTPTEREARLAIRDFDSGLVVVAESLRKKTKARNILVTLGAEGVLVHAPRGQKREWLTDRLPALNTAPKDPAGAGDSLLISSSMALTVGANIWESTYLGSLAAACQVGRIGNLPLSVADIQNELQQPEKR